MAKSVILKDFKEIQAYESGLNDGMLSFLLDTAFFKDGFYTQKESAAYKAGYNYDQKQHIKDLYCKAPNFKFVMRHLSDTKQIILKNHEIYYNCFTITYEEK